MIKSIIKRLGTIMLILFGLSAIIFTIDVIDESNKYKEKEMACKIEYKKYFSSPSTTDEEKLEYEFYRMVYCDMIRNIET